MATRRGSTGADRTPAPAPTRPPERHRRATNAAVVVVATLPFWQTPDDVLNPLFSAALSRALWPPVVAQALALLLFAAWRTGRPAPVSWRVCWSTLALWKVLSEPLLETLAEPLLALGPGYGVFAGRVLLGMVPTLALWTWLVDSLSCKKVSLIPCLHSLLSTGELALIAPGSGSRGPITCRRGSFRSSTSARSPSPSCCPA